MSLYWENRYVGRWSIGVDRQDRTKGLDIFDGPVDSFFPCGILSRRRLEVSKDFMAPGINVITSLSRNN